MRKAPEYQVLINYLLGICTPKELDNVEQWLSQSSDNVTKLERVLEELNKRDHPQVHKDRVRKRTFQKAYSI